MHCMRALKWHEAADRLLEGLDEDARRAVERAAAEHDSKPATKGDFLVEASWQGDVDLDLSIITPQGTRLSWLGGRVNVVGRDGSTPGNELIGLRRATAGHYIVEISRVADGDEPIAGHVTIRALEANKDMTFSLVTDRTKVGRAIVRRKSRMAPP